MLRRFAAVLVTGLLSLVVLGSFSVANAAGNTCTVTNDPLACACSTGGSSSAACTGRSSNDPVSGQNGVLAKTAGLIAMIAGIAAVIIIIIAGLMIVTAGDNAQRAQAGREAIIGTLVGVVIIAAAAGILTLVLRNL